MWTKNNLETEVFEKDDVTITTNFSAQVLFIHKSEIIGDCCVFKFPWLFVCGLGLKCVTRSTRARRKKLFFGFFLVGRAVSVRLWIVTVV